MIGSCETCKKKWHNCASFSNTKKFPACAFNGILNYICGMTNDTIECLHEAPCGPWCSLGKLVLAPDIMWRINVQEKKVCRSL
jgi:hypothetical protein